ncbi:MAG: gfo/Idh/MocA family oxidoreductase, partial [Chloroflexi bacterium HGW-Chloroflexi-8]
DNLQHHCTATIQKQVIPIPGAKFPMNAMLTSEGIYLSESLSREVYED